MPSTPIKSGLPTVRANTPPSEYPIEKNMMARANFLVLRPQKQYKIPKTKSAINKSELILLSFPSLFLA